MSLIPLLFVVAITAATIGLGIAATRASKTASDFFVAGRSVNAFWNSSAISGEYLSAASFMGIAGMLMKNGYDALWYPVGYATGYLFLLLFIAGPLRRFGAYTIPDFAEGRFDSPLFRKIAVTFVLFIGFFYTMPQMKGAGVTMVSILNWPYFAGILVVGTVITFNVAIGGMKGITIVQAMQYWAKLFAISAPVFVLMAIYGAYNTKLGDNAANPGRSPSLHKPVMLSFKGIAGAPANVVTFGPAGQSTIRFPSGAKLAKISTTYTLKPGESLQYPFDDPDHPNAVMGYLASGKNVEIPAGTGITSPLLVVNDNGPVEEKGKLVTAPLKLEFAEPTRAEVSGLVPNAPSNKKWIEPFGTLTGKYKHPLLYTYSLIIALVCGTAGLPHILVRFYTNPDGRSAKRTTMLVMILLGCFYVFPPVWGTLGRAVMPQLYANNLHDSVVIKLPMALDNRLLGLILSGITSAGAFAAFMSTFSGLLVSMSGAMAHDIYGRMIRPKSSSGERLFAFKVAAVVFGAIAMALGMAVESFDINMMVGWAFAIAAASYFPLLLLGSWWRGLTKYGAAIGMLSGGLLSLCAIVTSMLLDKKILAFEMNPVLRTLLEQPAIWGVPLAIVVMVVVSRMTEKHIPDDSHLKMLRLHAPEEMGLSKDYIAEH
jgi:cation/acetate symporter